MMILFQISVDIIYATPKMIDLIFQISGFAILIDRRNTTWQDLTAVFHKIVSLFPADIKEVFLLYKYPSGTLFGLIVYLLRSARGKQ